MLARSVEPLERNLSRHPAQKRDRGNVLLDGEVAEEPRAPAVFRHERHPVAHRRVRRLRANGATVEHDIAAAAAAYGEDRFHQFAATGPDESGEAENLSGAQVEADVAHVAVGGAQAADGEHARSRVELSRHGPVVRHVASDHRVDEGWQRRRARVVGPDRTAILEDGDAVTNLCDLVELMRDVDDPNAGAFELADHREEMPHLFFGER